MTPRQQNLAEQVRETDSGKRARRESSVASRMPGRLQRTSSFAFYADLFVTRRVLEEP